MASRQQCISGPGRTRASAAAALRGDAIWTALAVVGFDGLDYNGGEDLELGRARQRWIVGRGERLEVDGVVGRLSLESVRRQGWARWRDVPSAAV